jgi:3-hydroxybutyryl-CoA dehydrogenase
MDRLAIIGSGTMGHSIALHAALSGFHVCLWGVDELNLAEARCGIRKKLAVLAGNEFVSQKESEHVLHRILFTCCLEEAIKGAAFIIEAIPEQGTLKQDLFTRLERQINPAVILASNTSGLSPGKLASVLSRPERFIVTHFWNPAHLIPLVEVAMGPFTSENTVSRTLALLRKMKKRPIVIRKELPGFIGNRLQCALLREAQYLLEEGYASKEDIDAAVEYGIGRRLSVTGPLVSADLGGLDVFAALSDYLFPDLNGSTKAFATIQQLVSQNKLGQKTGEGYYKWDEAFSEKLITRREEELIRYMKKDLQHTSD